MLNKDTYKLLPLFPLCTVDCYLLSSATFSIILGDNYFHYYCFFITYLVKVNWKAGLPIHGPERLYYLERTRNHLNAVW